MWNIKALAFTVQKLLARLKFQREWQNDGMTEWQTGQKQYTPDLRSRGHKNTENYGTSIYEGRLPKTMKLWFIMEKTMVIYQNNWIFWTNL